MHVDCRSGRSRVERFAQLRGIWSASDDYLAAYIWEIGFLYFRLDARCAALRGARKRARRSGLQLL